MFLRTVAIMASVAILASFASADPILSLDAPSAYTPGTPFHVYVVLTGADDLASFSMDVILSCPQGVAGTDYFFSDAAQPSLRYVFLNNLTLGFSHSAAGEETITVGDSLSDLLAEVSTVPGVNDRLADITVGTLPSCTGDLTLSINNDTDFLFVDDKSGSSVPGYDSMVEGLTPATVAVPEPVSLILLAGGLMAMRATRRSAARMRR